MKKINNYCYNREAIKRKKLWHWENTIKKTNKDSKVKKMSCPYLFLEKEEIPRLESWINLLEAMREKMVDIKDPVKLNQYIPVILEIQKTFNQTPG